MEANHETNNVNTQDSNVDYNKMMKGMPSNSLQAKSTIDQTEKKRLDKVVTGTIKKKKKGMKGYWKTFKSAILPDTDMDMCDYVITDLLVPSIKTLVSSIITNSVEIALFGEVRGRRGKDDRYVSYNDYYRPDRRDRGRRSDGRATYRARSAINFDSDVFETRADADRVLDDLTAHIDQYGFASIGDYYDLIGVTGEFTDWKYGWDNLRNTRVLPERGGGYYIDFPRPIYME